MLAVLVMTWGEYLKARVLEAYYCLGAERWWSFKKGDLAEAE